MEYGKLKVIPCFAALL